MNARFPILVTVAVFATASPVPGQTLPDTVRTLIERRAEETLERLGAPGLSLAVWADGEVRYAEGFGLARVEEEIPARPTTLYRTASVAKPITATVVLRLAETGKIDLDAPVRRYCPDFPEKRWPVTVRQLLAHTAGVRHPEDAEDETTTRYASVKEALGVFAGDSLLHEPGTRRSYSTLGYMVLGCAIEGASGQSYTSALEELVLEPAGMTRTLPDTVARSDTTRALGYRKGDEGELKRSLEVDTSFKLAGGGLVSSVVDLARFGGALMEGKLLSEASLGEMLTVVEVPGAPAAPGTTFALGWVVGTREGIRYAIAPGQQEEVSSLLLILPDLDVAVALVSNLERRTRDIAPLATMVAGIVAGARAAPGGGR